MMTDYNPTGRERLLKLADLLDVADEYHREHGEPAYDQTEFVHECGTPACALGHWVAINQDRLRYKPRCSPCFERNVGGNWEPIMTSALWKEEFGLDVIAGICLFGVSGCGWAATAKQAADYIREFVRRKDES